LWSDDYEKKFLEILRRPLAGKKEDREVYHIKKSFLVVSIAGLDRVQRKSSGTTKGDVDTDDNFETHMDVTDNFGNELGSTNTDETESDATETDQSQDDTTSENVPDHFKNIRAAAAQGLKRQATRMLDRSVAKMKALDVGDNVLVPVSEFDRGRGDPQNLIGVVLEKSERGFKIGTKAGVLSGVFARNQLEMTKFNKIACDMIPSQKMSIRTAVRLLSVGEGQGKLKCSCQKGCLKNRCKCFKNKRDCNSACHPRITCKNIPQ
jgi:hypothetical protein